MGNIHCKSVNISSTPLSRLQDLDQILLKVLPKASDSSWRLLGKALLSIHQEEKVRFIADQLRHNVVYLTHHSVSLTSQRLADNDDATGQNEERLRMLQWLSIMDPSVYHKRAMQKRQPGTGKWFLSSDAFYRWKTEAGSCAWLHGIRKYLH